MGPHEAGAREVRELRLEGWTLYAVGAVILAALAGAFYLGRWVERRAGAGMARADRGSPVAASAPEPAVTTQAEAGYFDAPRGPEQEPEPEREARQPPPAGPTRVLEPLANEAAAPAGAFTVQVMALRDSASARTVLQELQGQGFQARLVAEREGRGTLYKLRVGTYATRQEAEASAERMRRAGYVGAFVVPREGTQR